MVGEKRERDLMGRERERNGPWIRWTCLIEREREREGGRERCRYM